MPVKNEAKKLALEARTILDEKKAENIVVLDLRKMNALADYFVICSGTSTRHADALSEEVAFGLKQRGHRLLHAEGAGTGTWVLLDFGDVIIHVFYHETRNFYNLDKLWGDAPRVV